MSTVKDLPSCNLKRPGNPNWVSALPYAEVKEIIKSYKFTCLYEYSNWVREQKMNGGGQGLPIHPHAVYSRKGEWVSKQDFLGLAPKINYAKYKEVNRKFRIPKKSSAFRFTSIIRQILGLNK